MIAAALAPAGADAVLVGEFNARVKDFAPRSGSYTVVAGARIYDTTGRPAPELAEASVSFPAGARLRSRFLRSRYYCDPALLQRRPVPKLCPRARFAAGRIVLDARPEVVESLSANLYLYLGKPQDRSEIASVVALVVPNELTPAYAFQVLRGRLVSAGPGRFGYRLLLPTKIEPLLPTVTLTLAEVRLTITGLRVRGREGSVFWTTAPRCPRGRKVWFGARYRFTGPVPTINRRRSISCTRLLRNPSGTGRGQIPGSG
jgi:hypothetical protein